MSLSTDISRFSALREGSPAQARLRGGGAPVKPPLGAWLLALALALASCSHTAPGTWPAATPTALLLLGEVHDNAAQPAQRLQRLQQALADGTRPALLMEQFDRERQPQIDQMLADAPAGLPRSPAQVQALADQLVALAGGAQAGWDWALYRPLINLALQQGLPLVAANVSRGDARAVIQQGLAARGFEAAVPADILAVQAAAIQASHCGRVDAATARRMAQAQVARDQFMARQLVAHAGRGAVLLAGNGHVRKDQGVPRWLPPELQARSRVIGFLEADAAQDAGAFDEVVPSPPQPRDDPCAAMHRAPSPASGAPTGPPTRGG